MQPAGPLVARKVPLPARPAAQHLHADWSAEFTGHQSLLHLRDDRLVCILKSDGDGQPGSIARRDHRIDVIHTPSRRLLAQHGLARFERDFGMASVQVDRQRQPHRVD